MTQDEKQLLLKDLCTRLPYGVKCNAVLKQIDGSLKSVFGAFKGYNGWATIGNNLVDIETVMPYLRLMSSMTEEEKKMICSMNMLSEAEFDDRIKYQKMYVNNYTIETFDLFNSNHLDYRGLIPMGLALEAPEGMYNNKINNKI